MAKRKQVPVATTFREFVRAAVFDQPQARQMIRSNSQWLTATSAIGETALADVVIENYLEATRFLIAQGADVNTRDYSGATPLMRAAELGYQNMTAVLLELGADVHAQDEDQETALFKAARYGYAEICDKLLQAGAQLNDNAWQQSIFGVILPRKYSLVLTVFERHGCTEPAEPLE